MHLPLAGRPRPPANGRPLERVAAGSKQPPKGRPIAIRALPLAPTTGRQAGARRREPASASRLRTTKRKPPLGRRVGDEPDATGAVEVWLLSDAKGTAGGRGPEPPASTACIQAPSRRRCLTPPEVRGAALPAAHCVEAWRSEEMLVVEGEQGCAERAARRAAATGAGLRADTPRAAGFDPGSSAAARATFVIVLKGRPARAVGLMVSRRGRALPR